jgi:putative mRNA 3-end processing factor
LYIPDFIKFSSGSLYCSVGDFYLDPKNPVKNAVISHAHADHAVPNNLRVYCTPGTEAIVKLRYGSQAGKIFLTAAFHQSFEVGGVKITFFQAGHIMGSAQVLMEYLGVRYLYTGDFKLQEDSTCEPFEFIKCDVLITETTYARPTHAHPDPEEEIKKISTLKDKNILLGAYVLGKAQRLAALISSHCKDKRIVKHSSVAPYSHLYEKHNLSCGIWENATGDIIKNNTNLVYIVPPTYFRRFNNNNKFYLVFASGWANLQTNCDISLNISDHADWEDILLLIQKTGPKVVLTTHGDGSHLKNYFLGSEIEIRIL